MKKLDRLWAPPLSKWFRHRWAWCHGSIISRGGVEDTRLEAKDKKKSEAKAKDSLSDDRHSRGQGQECSRPRPRTQAQVLSKKKKRSSQKFFRRSPQKKFFQKIFQALHKILTIQKIVLSSSEDRPIFEDLKPRGQGQSQGLDLRGLGQGLQNLSSRPRTSWRTPPLIISIELYAKFRHGPPLPGNLGRKF